MGERDETKAQLCDICHRRPAAFRVTVVENGRRRTLEVCREDYAQLRAQQASPFESLFGGSLFGDDMLGDFLDDGFRRSSGRSVPRQAGRPGRDREATDVGEVLSAQAEEILQQAARIAVERGGREVDSEHVLYALADNDVVQGAEEGRVEPKSETPNLDKYSRDLTALAKQGKLDPVIGRAQEIETVIEILARRKKNNPVLIGEPGVGKTAIVEGLAQRMLAGEVPEDLRDKRLVELNVNSLVAGTQYRGQFEERVKQLLDEVSARQENLILFIDELHTIVGAGSSGGEGGLDVANSFKPMLARGELNLIGATTLNEYQKHIEKDAALERRFQPVLVSEPTVEQTITILRGLRDTFEAHHKVTITDEAIVAAAELSDRYIRGRYMPDKAIDVIDQSAARVRLRGTSRPAG